MKKPSIKHWSEEDRPREKLIQTGKQNLSDAELIAILLGSGNRDLSALELSKHLLYQVDNNLDTLSKQSVHDLMRYKGIGEAKAVSLIAGLELGKRCTKYQIIKRDKISSSADAFKLMRHKLRDLPYEEFWILYLNQSNKLIESVKLSQGGVSGTTVDTRLMLKHAIELLASSIILVHNHPSGNLRPSQQDIQITQKMASGAKVFDIQVLDHLIISDEHFFSFADEGLI